MIRKLMTLYFCIVLINVSFISKTIESSNIERLTVNIIEKCSIINKGWVEESNGVKILHLNGSFYEMGYQLGYFLKYELLRNLRGLSNYIPDESFRLWNTQKNYIPSEIVDYIQGTADAIGLSFDDVGCIWIWERNPTRPDSHCSSYIADGPATKRNEIIHVYSLDFSFGPLDPITGLCVLDDPVLIVAKPDNGYAFMYPTFAGYVVESGVNEKGISISNTASPSKDENDYGAPVGIRVFEVLFHASTLEEAINILNKNRTFGYNFLVSDVNKNEGYVLEQTANLTYLSTWNDTTESKRPFYQLDHILRRTNCFINPETSATQRDYYNPKDLRNFLNFNFSDFSGLNNWCYYIHYKAISKGCQKFLGDLDLNTALSLIRNVYLNKYGGLTWFFLQKTYLKGIAWYQWSFCPKTGDILICYASGDKIASENPIHYFNFFELLEEEPPK